MTHFGEEDGVNLKNLKLYKHYKSFFKGAEL